MDSTIKTTVDGMLSGLAYVKVKDPSLVSEIEQYKADMYALGERSPDIMSFMTELQSSGLMDRMTTLMTRAATPQPTAGQADASSAKQRAPGALPSVREFLQQYRPGYEAAVGHGFQYTAVKAYEAMFAIADRTDDLLTMNVLLEQEGHLRAMTAAALYDVHKLHYDISDPNDFGVRETHQNLMNLALHYKTDEELYFQMDVLTHQGQQAQYRQNTWILVSAMLALACAGYDIAKAKARGDVAKYGGEFLAARDTIRSTCAAIGDIFGLNFAGMLANPFLKHWLLSPKTLDSTGRVTQCQDVRNLDYMRDVIFEEALSPLTDAQCLLRNPVHPFYPTLNVEHDAEQRAAQEAIAKAGKERLAGKYFHGYKKQVRVPGPPS